MLAEGGYFEPQRLTQAASLRSLTIPPLLRRAYPEINGLLVAEGVFRLYLMVYGQILTGGVQPMAGGVRLLVSQDDGVNLTLEQSIALLEEAMEVVKTVELTYMDAIEDTIDDILLDGSPAPPRSDSRRTLATTWGKVRDLR